MGRAKKTALSVDKVYQYDISKANSFVISAAFDYTLIEQKIVNYIAMKIHPPKLDDSNNVVYDLIYDIDYSEICKMSAMPINGRSYTYITKAITNLKVKNLDVQMPNKKITGISFFTRYEYLAGSGLATVELDTRTVPLVMRMKDDFLKYNPRYTMLCKSKYSIRIYEWLKATMDKQQWSAKKSSPTLKINNDKIPYMTKKEKEEFFQAHKAIREKDYIIKIDIDIFKENLGIGSSIEGFKMMESRILNKARTELNEWSDILITDISFNNETNNIRFVANYKTASELALLNVKIEDKINSVYLPKK